MTDLTPRVALSCHVSLSPTDSKPYVYWVAGVGRDSHGAPDYDASGPSPEVALMFLAEMLYDEMIEKRIV